MDAFYASVELLARPELRGKPAVVAHDSPRSVVTSATYEARALGIRSAMPLGIAQQKVSGLIVLEPHMSVYRDYSRQVMSVCEQVTPYVEQLSIDEAFLDVTGAQKLLGTPQEIAHKLKKDIYDSTGLTCSVGGASTKFLAKVASTRSKPDGLLIIDEDKSLEFLHPLPLESLWGVGKKTSAALHNLGLHTVADVAHARPEMLIAALGRAQGEHLHNLAWGIDPRVVSPERIDQSIGKEHTFNEDVTDLNTLTAALLNQAEEVGYRLRKNAFVAKTISIKLTFAHFEQTTKSKTLPEATSVSREIYQVACELLDAVPLEGRAVRLIGIRASSFFEPGSPQLTLWEDEMSSWEQAERAIDHLTEKFGKTAVRPATLLRNIEPTRESGTPG